MFTGIIQAIGLVRRIQRQQGALRLEVAQSAWKRVARGDSVAVDGVCLTVTQNSHGRLAFDAVPETLRMTTLGRLTPGARVNLERAVQLSDRLSGHLVTGHIDGVGTIRHRQLERGQLALDLALPTPLSRYVIPKGSIAIDGISLTVGAIRNNRCRVYLIPETRRVTALGGKPVGSHVNVEVDLIGKYVARLLRRQ